MVCNINNTGEKQGAAATWRYQEFQVWILAQFQEEGRKIQEEGRESGMVVPWNFYKRVVFVGHTSYILLYRVYVCIGYNNNIYAFIVVQW